MPKEKKYNSTQRYDGEWFPAPHFLGCCDCGLVHTVDFRIRDGKLQMRVFRDPEGTLLKRRSRRFIMRRHATKKH